jgi:hypothetical protein
MLFAALYSALRLVLELAKLESKDAAGLEAEVLALRQQVRGCSNGRSSVRAGSLAIA